MQAVILNACYSAEQAVVIGKYVTYVIGTTVSIGDVAAIAFSGGFYHKFIETGSFEDAYQSGRTRATMNGSDESYFVMYKNGEKLNL